MMNRSKRKAFYNVIDLQPDGKINPLLPDVAAGEVRPPIAELVLDPGEKTVIKYPILISKPYGNEIFKVIATGAPFDLGSAINTKGLDRGARGTLSDIEALMGNTFDKSFSPRGAHARVSQREMGTNTSAFTFKIVRKN
jgi:hypothetical protein